MIRFFLLICELLPAFRAYFTELSDIEIGKLLSYLLSVVLEEE
jgi:hypothetical protein